MRIAGMHSCSLIDYPGKICSILFAQGCNFRCPYCHNPQLVAPELFENLMQQERLFAFLAKRKGKLDAVTISGGEPTLQPGLRSFICKIKDMGFDIKLDTNGSRPDVLGELLEEKLLDFVAMDLKAPLSQYSRVVGASVESDTIRRSINLIISSCVEYEFRTTWVPNLLSVDDLMEMAESIRGAERYVIQRFIPDRTLDHHFQDFKPSSPAFLEEIRKSLANKGVSTVVVR